MRNFKSRFSARIGRYQSWNEGNAARVSGDAEGAGPGDSNLSRRDENFTRTDQQSTH